MPLITGRLSISVVLGPKPVSEVFSQPCLSQLTTWMMGITCLVTQISSTYILPANADFYDTQTSRINQLLGYTHF